MLEAFEIRFVERLPLKVVSQNGSFIAEGAEGSRREEYLKPVGVLVPIFSFATPHRFSFARLFATRSLDAFFHAVGSPTLLSLSSLF